MTDIRWKQRFSNFQRALQCLTEAIELLRQRPLSKLEEQGLIQGFEFTHELAWNVLKDYLEMEGIQGIVGSRSTAREAFKRGLVGDGEAWMDMIETRNLSSHTYNQAVASSILADVRDRYYPAFLALQTRLGGEP
ncbi:MAG: nucleotidyltransferase substrate binding protein [Myxococcales bacterium]|nr:nucleotidyltransferase substrate binding protein [Myxococcales bacterium]